MPWVTQLVGGGGERGEGGNLGSQIFSPGSFSVWLTYTGQCAVYVSLRSSLMRGKGEQGLHSSSEHTLGSHGEKSQHCPVWNAAGEPLRMFSDLGGEGLVQEEAFLI